MPESAAAQKPELARPFEVRFWGRLAIFGSQSTQLAAMASKTSERRMVKMKALLSCVWASET